MIADNGLLFLATLYNYY